MTVKRFKVWRIELMELDEDETIKADEDCEIVVLASDYDELQSDLEMALNDDRGVL
jgi:hypothetical protein